jgi:hypothetical protein
MIDTLLWCTGLAVWAWIAFIGVLSLVVEIHNRSLAKRGREEGSGG